ncbi:MAG: histidine kinase N-terminal 7TM domain-containing protein, partial [bacterium]
MDIKNVFLLLATIINITLSILVYLRSSKKVAHLAYSLFAFSVGLWAFVLAMFRYVTDLNIALWWMKISYIAAVIIACSFLYFSLYFPENKKLKTKTNFFILAPTILLSLLLLSSKFLVKEVIITSFGRDIISVDWGHIVFALYFTTFFFGGICVAFYKYKHLIGITKDQLRYVILGTLIAGTFGAFFNLVIPLFWNTHKFVWLGPLFTVFIIACSSYAITRYRLMDIRIAIRKSAVYFLAAIFSYGFFYFSAWLLTRLFGDIYAGGALFFGIFIAVCFVSLFFLVEKIINILANKYFFASLYNQHETLKKLSEKITSVVDLKKLIADITNVLKKELFLEKL